jgi:Zn-dependent peptidase ImmA (M78 family)
MLFRDDELTVIGVNSLHPKMRRRFTIAHELGHCLLHKGMETYLDRSVRLNFRDERSALAVDRNEIEANAFAAELLMPRPAFTRVLLETAHRDSQSDRQFLKNLATLFEVSGQAMEHRLVNLNVLAPR